MPLSSSRLPLTQMTNPYTVSDNPRLDTACMTAYLPSPLSPAPTRQLSCCCRPTRSHCYHPLRWKFYSSALSLLYLCRYPAPQIRVAHAVMNRKSSLLVYGSVASWLHYIPTVPHKLEPVPFCYMWGNAERAVRSLWVSLCGTACNDRTRVLNTFRHE